MTHPDSLTGADVFDVPDASLSPSDPALLVPWLRALSVGTVLLDKEQRAWQLRAGKFTLPGGRVADRAFMAAGVSTKYPMRAADLRTLAKRGPFRIIWTSGGGQPVRRGTLTIT